MQPPPPPPGGRPPYGPPGGPPGPPGPPGWGQPPSGPPGWGPPGPPPHRPGGNGPVIAILAIVAVLVLIGGGVFLVAGGDDDDDPTIRPLAATPTDADLPTRTYSPPSLPTSEPSTPEPTTPEPAYTPPPRNYGAIAVGRNGAIGKAWDYDTAAAAKRRALNECPTSGCKVLTTFVNGCGAVAFNSATNKYWGGHGSTKAAAQKNAIANAGGGRSITWVCTTR